MTEQPTIGIKPIFTPKSLGLNAFAPAAMTAIANFNAGLPRDLRANVGELYGLNKVAQSHVSEMMPDATATIGLRSFNQRWQDQLNKDLAPVLDKTLKQQRERAAMIAKLAPLLSQNYAKLFEGASTFAGIFQQQVPGLVPTPRVAPSPRRTQEHDRVDAFLGSLHPILIEKRAAMHAPVDRPDGISQNANSAAELMRILLDRLVPCKDVWDYMRELGLDVRGNRGKTRPPKDRHFELVAHRHGVDAVVVLDLSFDGGLGNRFEALKHDSYMRPRIVVADELRHLIDRLERLLDFLASSLQR